MSVVASKLRVVEGQKLFLLREVTQGHYTFEQDSLLTVIAVEGQEFVVSGSAKHEWRYQREQAEARFPIAAATDAGQFLWLVDQEIDGLSFSAEPPAEPGDYWFYGLSSESKGRLRLGIGRVSRGGDDKLSFWFFGDLVFQGKSFSMHGLWAKAWAPSMPGHKHPGSIDK